MVVWAGWAIEADDSTAQALEEMLSLGWGDMDEDPFSEGRGFDETERQQQW